MKEFCNLGQLVEVLLPNEMLPEKIEFDLTDNKGIYQCKMHCKGVVNNKLEDVVIECKTKLPKDFRIVYSNESKEVFTIETKE